MAQTTLEQYFVRLRLRRAASSVTFLDLPASLRRRIYLNAGLLSNSTIFLNYVPSSGNHCDQEYGADDQEQWPTEETISARSLSLAHFLDSYLPWPQICLNRHCLCLEQQSTYEAQCNCAALPHQLLYVSKAIAKEVSAIFYSENDFSVYWTALGGLSGLSRLPPKSLALMNSLSVCLNFYEKDHRWYHEVGPDRGGSCHPACRTSKLERPFSNTKKPDEQAALKEWKLLCALLASQVQPKSLKLFLTCDVANFEIAEEVVRPLLQLPTLQECAVRLGSYTIDIEFNHSQTLTELARRSVNEVTLRSAQRTFRYQDLPKEIQIRILGYTELATPFDLVWALNTDVAKAIKSPYYENRTFNLYGSAWNSSSCCQNCSPNSQPCACWTGKAAFSTTCTCWRFPLSFFLVNHDMRKDAEFIFYSRNNFLLIPRRRDKSKHLEIYNFLKHLPINGRRYLRSVTWMLSDLDRVDGYLEPDDLTYLEWLTATKILMQDVLPGQLRLTIDPQYDLQAILCANGSEYMHVPADCGTVEAEHTWTVCERLAASLSGNNHLGDLFIHFIWPFENHRDGTLRDRGAILEKRVLGENYDGRSRGKFERRCRWNGYSCDLNDKGECIVCRS